MLTKTPKTKRAPNFLPEEEKQLARSWACTSQNAVRSNKQGKEEFFACVTKEFNKFTPGPQSNAATNTIRSLYHKDLYQKKWIKPIFTGRGAQGNRIGHKRIFIKALIRERLHANTLQVHIYWLQRCPERLTRSSKQVSILHLSCLLII
jgi:hypothetical protein